MRKLIEIVWLYCEFCYTEESYLKRWDDGTTSSGCGFCDNVKRTKEIGVYHE